MKNDSELETVLFTASSAGVLALVIGVFRSIIQTKRGWFNWTRGVITSILVGVTVGLGIDSLNIALTAKFAVVAVTAYLADDLLTGLLVVGSTFREDPMSFVKKLIDSLRGKGTS